VWRQVNLDGRAILARGGWARRRGDDRFLLVDEESVEPPAGGGGSHRPDDELDGQRHNLSHFVAEHDGEQRREAPDGSLDRVALGGVAVEALIVAKAGEERHQVEVGDDHEGDGASVAVGAVDRHAGVEGEEDEAKHRQPGEVCHRWRRR